MARISVRISPEERDYLDRQIDKGKFASYGHAFRGLLYYYKNYKRVISRLRKSNAVLKHELKKCRRGD